MSRRRWLVAMIAAALVNAVSQSPLLAQRRGGAAVEALRAIELQKLQDIQALVRSTQQCLIEAYTLRELRGCHKREREVEWGIRQRHQQRLEEVRNRYDLEQGMRPPGPPPGGGPPPRW